MNRVGKLPHDAVGTSAECIEVEVGDRPVGNDLPPADEDVSRASRPTDDRAQQPVVKAGVA
jgi:hypothetical protein